MSDETPSEEYGILCRALFPENEDDAVFGFTWAEVQVGGVSTPHAHAEHEAFVIASGSGVIDVAGTQTDLSTGDTVFIPAGDEHTIRNTVDEPLRFVAIWWERSADGRPVGA